MTFQILNDQGKITKASRKKIECQNLDICGAISLCGDPRGAYGMATIRNPLKITGLFCKRALQKRRYSAKETYNFKEPTNRSHLILRGPDLQTLASHEAPHCNALQHTATHCNTLQLTATHCISLEHTATHCNTL